MKRVLILLLLTLTVSAGAADTQPKVADKVFLPLAGWLVEQGESRAEVEKYFAQVKFEGKVLASMLSHKEVTRDYEGFLAQSKIKRAQSFKNKYMQALQQAEKATDVPAGVIVAIILIESDLGGYTGKSSAMNVLASQAVLDSALALIRLCREWKVSPVSIKGSPAGALGWCQFMPSSIEKWGADGSGDKRVDVNNPLDAIASIARYLNQHGWQANMTYEQQIQVVLTYNKSTPYAQAVLKVAEKL